MSTSENKFCLLKNCRIASAVLRRLFRIAVQFFCRNARFRSKPGRESVGVPGFLKGNNLSYVRAFA